MKKLTQTLIFGFVLVTCLNASPAQAGFESSGRLLHHARVSALAAAAALAAQFAPMHVEAQEVIKSPDIPPALLEVRPERLTSLTKVRDALPVIESAGYRLGLAINVSQDLPSTTFTFKETDNVPVIGRDGKIVKVFINGQPGGPVPLTNPVERIKTKVLTDPEAIQQFRARNTARITNEENGFTLKPIIGNTQLELDLFNAIVTQRNAIKEALDADPKRREALEALGIGAVDFQVVDERLHAGKQAPLSATVINGEAKAASRNKKNKNDKQGATLPNTLQVSFGINPEDVAAQTASGENLRVLDAGTLLDQLVEAADKLKERNATYEALKAGKLN
jgi:hypothetical protein